MDPAQAVRQIAFQLERAGTVGGALEDWLARGVGGLSARTVTLWRGRSRRPFTKSF